MYHYNKKLQEEAAKFQPKSVVSNEIAAPKVENQSVNEDREVTLDEMLRVLSDKTPHIVIPVNEFFGWFKTKATPAEQLLLTSFSSVVLPRLAAKINSNANSPEKVLKILNTECTQKERDLISRLASEIILVWLRSITSPRWNLLNLAAVHHTISVRYLKKQSVLYKRRFLDSVVRKLHQRFQIFITVHHKDGRQQR